MRAVGASSVAERAPRATNVAERAPTAGKRGETRHQRTLDEPPRPGSQDRGRRFRGDAAAIPVEGRVVILVDDGVATGGTARAAIQTLEARHAGRIVLAVPVGAAETIDELAGLADDLVCLHPEERFFAVSQWYESFRATTDEEVVDLLARARTRELPIARQPRGSERVRVPTVRSVQIPTGERSLFGKLTLLPEATGLVIFAYGPGSGRHSPKSQYVAGELESAGMATLLVDLLAPEEDAARAFTTHPDVDLAQLAGRLVSVVDWVRAQPELEGLRIGLYGGGPGAAAALIVAAERPDVVRAVVSRAGHPDLAGASLERVTAPTLLLVGGADSEMLARNRAAFDRLEGDKRLERIPSGASMPFEEEPVLEVATRSAVRWFRFWLDDEAHSLTA